MMMSFQRLIFSWLPKKTGLKLKLRFNTKKLSIEELKSFVAAFQDENAEGLIVKGVQKNQDINYSMLKRNEGKFRYFLD